MNIVFGPAISDRAWEIGKSLLPSGFNIEVLNSDDPAVRRQQWERADFFMGFRYGIKASDYEHMKRLKLVQMLSAGYDGIDIEKLRARGVPMANNGGANSFAVSEHALMLMLACSRKLIELDQALRKGQWRASKLGEEEAHEVAGRTIGIVGFGMIGRMLAKRLSGFEVKTLYADPVRAPSDVEKSLGAEHHDLDSLFRECDIITLHAPADATTRQMINKRTIELMKREAIIINCARGDLIDEPALYEALQSGRIAGAGLDTFDPEPPKPDNPLFKLPNVVVTPHAAGPTWESWPKRFGHSYENVQRVARGEKPQWVVPELRD